jgi:stearoyl-CoA desaturase (delta-9 desaturase)
VDEDGAPLGLVKGLWHAHIGWFFSRSSWFFSRGREHELARVARDVHDDRLVMAIDRLYGVWMLVSLALPFTIGFLAGGTVELGVEAMVWGGLVRVFLLHHVTWSVNSICHTVGTREYRARDESRNNWLLALPSLGEGWHNNHHAFPSAALYGIGRKQVDLAGLVLVGLERLGLASELKRHDPRQLERRRLRAAES